MKLWPLHLLVFFLMLCPFQLLAQTPQMTQMMDVHTVQMTNPAVIGQEISEEYPALLKDGLDTQDVRATIEELDSDLEICTQEASTGSVICKEATGKL